MVMLCTVVSGHSKRNIKLRDQARHLKYPIEVYIDGQTLEFDISNESDVFDVVIEDVSGNIVDNYVIEKSCGLIPIELSLQKGIYIIIVTCNECKLCGEFYIE